MRIFSRIGDAPARLWVGVVALCIFVAIAAWAAVGTMNHATRLAREWAAKRDSALVRADVAQAYADTATRRMREAEQLAAARAQSIDSLERRGVELEDAAHATRAGARAALAAARDSGASLEVVRYRYERAVGLYEATVDSLALAVRVERSRGDSLALTVMELRDAMAAADSAVARLVPVNRELGALVRAAEPGCYVVWRVRCPSRRQALVGGVVAGVVGGVVVGRALGDRPVRRELVTVAPERRRPLP